MACKAISTQRPPELIRLSPRLLILGICPFAGISAIGNWVATCKTANGLFKSLEGRKVVYLYFGSGGRLPHWYLILELHGGALSARLQSLSEQERGVLHEAAISRIGGAQSACWKLIAHYEEGRLRLHDVYMQSGLQGSDQPLPRLLWTHCVNEAAKAGRVETFKWLLSFNGYQLDDYKRGDLINSMLQIHSEFAENHNRNVRLLIEAGSLPPGLQRISHLSEGHHTIVRMLIEAGPLPPVNHSWAISYAAQKAQAGILALLLRQELTVTANLKKAVEDAVEAGSLLCLRLLLSEERGGVSISRTIEAVWRSSIRRTNQKQLRSKSDTAFSEWELQWMLDKAAREGRPDIVAYLARRFILPHGEARRRMAASKESAINNALPRLPNHPGTICRLM